jgi:hypothetical protein
MIQFLNCKSMIFNLLFSTGRELNHGDETYHNRGILPLVVIHSIQEMDLTGELKQR